MKSRLFYHEKGHIRTQDVLLLTQSTCVYFEVPSEIGGSSNGHFVPEVWLDEFESWAMIDPNLHLCYRDGSTHRPLAVAELYARREQLSALEQCGAGFDAQTKVLQTFAQEHCFSSEVYRL